MIKFVSLDSLIRDMLETVRGSNVTGSENISENQIEKWIHEYRAVLLKQDMDKGRGIINQAYIQEIPSIEIQAVDSSESILPYIRSGVLVFRTSVQIPKTIDFKYKSGIMSVSTLDDKEIQLVQHKRAEWQQYKKYTSTDSLAYLKNNYLYIYHPSMLTHVKVRGIFEVPTEIYYMSIPSISTPTDIRSMAYPIPIDIIPALKALIMKQEFGTTLASPQDTTNDSRINNPQTRSR